MTDNDTPVLGDMTLVVDFNAEEIVIHEVNMHGYVELARGDTLDEALRATADAVEDND